MKPFLDEDFLLTNPSAVRLYHEHARDLPILDYHCHLSPQQIADDHGFKNLTEIWLAGDHYKWRAMRANGVDESFITGSRSDEEKFNQWARTVPYTLRNPLYHWTHLELRRYFGIDTLLSEKTARTLYEAAGEQLRSPAFSTRQLLQKMQVERVCTTDDPLDDLAAHAKMKKEEGGLIVLPTFRPDAAMRTEDPFQFKQYAVALERVSNHDTGSFADYSKALFTRHDYFAAHGCTQSDHGLEHIYAEPYTDAAVDAAYALLRQGKEADLYAQHQLKSALLHQFAQWDHAKGWVQQFHLGALRNNSGRLVKMAGADAGADSIGDFGQARPLSRFLNRLDEAGTLAKTILYNLNPADNELMATMAGNFNDGSSPGKIQWGAAWWFLDQQDGMKKQLDTLSNLGLLSRFVGMITDSRSFLSFPRHEYFRRILCNLIGTDIENGEMPDDPAWNGQLIRNICYDNAKQYFGWH